MPGIPFRCVDLQLKPSTEQYGRFIAEPLEIGCGITIGTILRRVLLTSILGLRIVGVRITDINTEYGTIPGIKEDVLEILLNLKEVVFQSPQNQALFWDKPIGHIKIEGPAVVTAGSIVLPSHVKVVNSAHYIATVAEGSFLILETHLDWGKGYRLAENQKPLNKGESADYLKMDSIFAPVSRVNCTIESLGADPTSTDFSQEREKLILEIWTNGSIRPDEAFFEATKVIVDWFKDIWEAQLPSQENLPFFDNNNRYFQEQIQKTIDEGVDLSFDEDFDLPFEAEMHKIPIEDLNLSVRSFNALKRAQINFVDELSQYSLQELKQIKNFGQKSLKEVLDILADQFDIILR